VPDVVDIGFEVASDVRVVGDEGDGAGSPRPESSQSSLRTSLSASSEVVAGRRPMARSGSASSPLTAARRGSEAVQR
jgi:hypothetical protein